MMNMEFGHFISPFEIVKDVFLNELGLKAELLYVALLTTRQEGS